MRPARLITLAMAGLTVLTVFTACGKSRPGGTDVTVTATDTECRVARTSLPAGTYNFMVANKGTKITEFYVYQGDKVVGEVENISPGVTRNMRVELAAGTYEGACKPGMKGDGIRTKITVSGGGTALFS